jgi:hypothetical protein
MLHVSLPPMSLSHGMSTPRRSATYTGGGERAYAAGIGPGWFGFYSMGARLAFATGGDIDEPFGTLTDGSARMMSIELPSPGYGYRTRSFLVGAQLVPAIEWYSEDYTDTSMTFNKSVTGSDHFYTLEADVQVCYAYNMFGMWMKNSAVCAYAEPSIYRAGWGNGLEVGLRWFML